MIKGALLCCALLSLAGASHAQGYPNKPVRMIVAVPPGGPADTLARLVGPRLSEALDEMAAHSASDGYTFVHVPFKGGGPALTNVIAGQVQALFSIALAATP